VIFFFRSVLQYFKESYTRLTVCCSVLQCVAVCCSVLQRGAVIRRVLHKAVAVDLQNAL